MIRRLTVNCKALQGHLHMCRGLPALDRPHTTFFQLKYRKRLLLPHEPAAAYGDSRALCTITALLRFEM